MATFGREDKGTLGIGVGSGSIRGSTFPCTESGTLNNGSCFILSSTACNGYFLVYRVSDWKLIAVSAETVIPIMNGWLDFPLGNEAVIAEDYGLFLMPDNDIGVYRDADTDRYKWQNVTYPNYPDPLVPATLSYILSVHCDYTPSVVPVGGHTPFYFTMPKVPLSVRRLPKCFPRLVA